MSWIKRLLKKRKQAFKYPQKPVLQNVIETDKAVYIDGNELKYVLTDSVKTVSIGKITVVTLSFLASEFLKK